MPSVTDTPQRPPLRRSPSQTSSLVKPVPAPTPLNPEAETSRALAHFRSIPWCLPHLSIPDLTFTGHVGRTPSTTRYLFWGRTLATPSTIPYFLAFYPPPVSTSPSPEVTLPHRPFIPSVSVFLTLGRGLGMHDPGSASGGAVAAIFDECICALPVVNVMEGYLVGVPYTQGLRVRFERPVRTDATVLVEVGLRNVVGGRRFVVEAVMSDEEGVVLARGEGTVCYGRQKL